MNPSIRKPVTIESWTIEAVNLWAKHWFVLTGGLFAPGQFNPMTVSWGMFGELWSKPVAMVFVRPSRHTYGFMEHNDSFTLCAFPEEHRNALQVCGTMSGRSGDKLSLAGLTPMASTTVAAPCYAEANLVVECRKLYFDDLKPSHFLSPEIEANYGGRDYHRCYIGEIVAVGVAAVTSG